MTLALLCIFASQTAQAQVFIPSWTGLSAKYDYQHLKPTDVKESSAVDGDNTKITFSFPGSPGDTVHGVLVEPKSVGAMPCVILLHGLGGDKTNLMQMVGKGLLDKGIAYAAIDAPGHGERATADDKKEIGVINGAFFVSKGDLLEAAIKQDKDGKVIEFLGRAVKDGILDNRHLLDYLTSRKEIDYNNVGAIGQSMGSIMSAILGPVDPRIHVMALMVGGDPVLPLMSSVSASDRDLAIATACSLFAPHYINRPVRMLNGTKDTIMPRAATDRLYDAFPADANMKSISWFNSDHFLPPLANVESVQFCADHLGKGDTTPLVARADHFVSGTNTDLGASLSERTKTAKR